MSKNLLYEDLIGNVCDLEQDIRNNIKTQNELGINVWSDIWSLHIINSDIKEQIAIIKINITVNQNIFDQELIIYKSSSQENRKRFSFTIQWGSVPHPVIPIIYSWLKKTDSSRKRTQQRNQKIKEELIKVTFPNNLLDGI